jgi:hypothetical protein
MNTRNYSCFHNSTIPRTKFGDRFTSCVGKVYLTSVDTSWRSSDQILIFFSLTKLIMRVVIVVVTSHVRFAIGPMGETYMQPYL